MYFVVKSVSWIDKVHGKNVPMVSAIVEEAFTDIEDMRAYVKNGIDFLPEKNFDVSGDETIYGSHLPDVSIYDKKAKEWIRYYCQEKRVVV